MPRRRWPSSGSRRRWGIVNGHKGGVGFDLHFHGYEVHSLDRLQGRSPAIMEGAKLIAGPTATETRATPPRRTRQRFIIHPTTTLPRPAMIQGGNGA